QARHPQPLTGLSLEAALKGVAAVVLVDVPGDLAPVLDGDGGETQLAAALVNLDLDRSSLGLADLRQPLPEAFLRHVVGGEELAGSRGDRSARATEDGLRLVLQAEEADRGGGAQRLEVCRGLIE